MNIFKKDAIKIASKALKIFPPEKITKTLAQAKLVVATGDCSNYTCPREGSCDACPIAVVLKAVDRFRGCPTLSADYTKFEDYKVQFFIKVCESIVSNSLIDLTNNGFEDPDT